MTDLTDNTTADHAGIDTLDVFAAAIGIVIAPEWRVGVRHNLETSLRMAELVAAFPLDDEADAAPIYQVPDYPKTTCTR